jgi:hypothetical protein
MEVSVSVTYRPPYPPGKRYCSFEQEAGWSNGYGEDKFLASAGKQTPVVQL